MQSLLLIETNVQSHKSVFLLVPKAFSVQYAQVFTAPPFISIKYDSHAHVTNLIHTNKWTG